jgi:hypothetical protein
MRVERHQNKTKNTRKNSGQTINGGLFQQVFGSTQNDNRWLENKSTKIVKQS